LVKVSSWRIHKVLPNYRSKCENCGKTVEIDQKVNKVTLQTLLAFKRLIVIERRHNGLYSVEVSSWRIHKVSPNYRSKCENCGKTLEIDQKVDKVTLQTLLAFKRLIVPARRHNGLYSVGVSSWRIHKVPPNYRSKCANWGKTVEIDQQVDKATLQTLFAFIRLSDPASLTYGLYSVKVSAWRIYKVIPNYRSKREIWGKIVEMNKQWIHLLFKLC